MNTAEKLETRMKSNSHETRIALLEQSTHFINETLLRLEKKIDERFERMDQHLDKLEQKIDKFSDRLWTNFYWILGTIFTLSSVLAGLMAKGFHWFS